MINKEDLKNAHKFIERFLNGTSMCPKCKKSYSKRIDAEGGWINSMCDCKVGICYSNGAVIIKKKQEYDRVKLRNFVSKEMRDKLRELGT